MAGLDIQRLLTAQAFCVSKITNGAETRISAIADSVTEQPNTLYDRLMAVKPAGLSRNAWTAKAGVSRNVFNDIRKRDSANHGTIIRLLDAVGLTWAEYEAGVIPADREAPTPEARAPRMAFQGPDRPRDVPVLGTAECGDIELGTDGTAVRIETMELHLDDVVDHVRRPVALDNRRDAYAIYFQGDSMSPRYEAGELAYVDPRRPPAQRDYVVIQLRRPDGEDGERVYRVLAKRLLRRTGDFYELEQFNPPLIFRVPNTDVAHCHRIYEWSELVAF